MWQFDILGNTKNLIINGPCAIHLNTITLEIFTKRITTTLLKVTHLKPSRAPREKGVKSLSNDSINPLSLLLNSCIWCLKFSSSFKKIGVLSFSKNDIPRSHE